MRHPPLNNFFTRAVTTVAVLWPATVWAAPQGEGMAGKIGGALKSTACAAGFCPTQGVPKGFIEILGAYTNFTIGFLGLVFLVLTIWHGFKWMTAAGNEEQVKKAQTGIRNAAIGLGIVLLARMITYVILQLIKPAITP